MTLVNKGAGSGARGAGETHRPGYERVAAKIMGLITASNLQPGDRLPTERALSEQLGVSRTVVREAVKALAATGVVRSQQGSGLYLNSAPKPFASAAIDLSMSVEPEQVENLYEFRILLEARAAMLAAERITAKELRQLQEALARNKQGAETGDIDLFHDSDEDLHRGIAEATRNPFLASAVTTVHHFQDWVSLLVIGGTPGSTLIAAEQHASILAAIADGQAELAGQRMQMHIETTVANYQQEVRRRLLGESAGG